MSASNVQSHVKLLCNVCVPVCLFGNSLSRYGPAVDPNKDLDWNAEYYVTYARRTISEF